MVFEPDVTSRRTWLGRSLVATIAATLVAILYPVVRFLRPQRAVISGAPEMVAPFKLKELPNAPGNPFNFGGKPCLVVLTSEGAKRVARGELPRADEIKAFNAVCTHVDCTVKYRPQEGDIYCSCHEGVYDLNGHNVSGPPPRPLASYKVTLRGEQGQEEIVISRQT
ncbi:MAG: QcrA and Rieske domain-containing protein [Pirellulaceae bacterium]